jgi:hypothetical protein
MVVRIMAMVTSALGLLMTLAAGFGPPDPVRGEFAIAGSILIAAGLLVFAMDGRPQT